MYSMIERYINKLTIDDVNKFALSKDCFLSNDELNFTFSFIKNNWRKLINNNFNIEQYKSHYSPENFAKIKKVYKEYFQKFSFLL